MIHYIYRIDFLCGEPGRYYLGKRSYKGKNIENDKYGGSGCFCKEYYKKYGKVKGETYNITILEINSSVKENSSREIVVIGDLWKTDPLCMNRCPGGNWNEDPNRTKVKQYDLSGNLIAEFNSIIEAETATGAKNISGCCLGMHNYKTAGGFVWRYYDDPFDKYYVPERIQETRYRKVNQYSPDGKFIKTWNSIKEAAEAYNDNKRSFAALTDYLHGRGRNFWCGYYWKFYDGSTEDVELTKTPKTVRYRIAQYDKNGKFIAEYPSISQACIAVNSKNREGIKLCAEGKQMYSAGYIWKYVNGKENGKENGN